MTLTSSEFFDFFPAFENKVSAEVVDIWIEQACEYVNVTLWAGKAKMGIGLMTAHLMTYLGVVDGSIGGAASAIKKEVVGDLSVEYETNSQATDVDGLEATKYGRQFKAIRKTVAKTPLVRGCIL